MSFRAIPVLLLMTACGVFAQQKIAIVRIQEAIGSTQDGKKAEEALQARFAPAIAKQSRDQAALQADREKLRRGSRRCWWWPWRRVMSARRRATLAREIEAKAKLLNQETAQLEAEKAQELRRVLQDLARRMMPLVNKYAEQNGYLLVLDGRVLFGANNVTRDIVRLYDRTYPVR